VRGRPRAKRQLQVAAGGATATQGEKHFSILKACGFWMSRREAEEGGSGPALTHVPVKYSPS